MMARMSIEPYQQAIATTRSILTNVRPDQLDDDTPCQSWKVRDVINHLIGSQSFFSAAAAGTPPAGPTDPAAGDFVAAYDEETKKAVAALGADGVMSKTLTLPFGQMPGAAVAGLAATDTFVHGWDLAKATGQSTDLEPQLAAGLLTAARGAIQPGFRGADGVSPFGAEQEAPDGASEADRLAAFLGRTV
jgi:uncharacterized protein (TIGR03086 family)